MYYSPEPSQAFTNFKKTYDICDVHAERQYHKQSVVICDARMSGRQERQESQLRSELREIIRTKTPFNCRDLCGRQNLATDVEQKPWQLEGIDTTLGAATYTPASLVTGH